jgi:hypothetical protein
MALPICSSCCSGCQYPSMRKLGALPILTLQALLPTIFFRVQGQKAPAPILHCKKDPRVQGSSVHYITLPHILYLFHTLLILMHIRQPTVSRIQNTSIIQKSSTIIHGKTSQIASSINRRWPPLNLLQRPQHSLKANHHF